MTLPLHFAWLADEPSPKMIVEALKLYGVHETLGPGNNPVILQWAKEVGLDKDYRTDSTAWCGLFLAYIAKKAGKIIPTQPLWALNWRTFGNPADVAMLGDVLVFERRDTAHKLIGGHVGLYVAERTDAYFVLGGNEADQVNIVPIDKSRCVAVRRPIYRVQPSNVRRIFLDASGKPSTNEA